MEKMTLNLLGQDDFFTQEAYKVLRTNLQFCGKDVKVIAFTSCNENEGKSTITLGLAKSLADLGKSVLLIDADMRKSVIANRNSNINEHNGLSEYLIGQKTLDECVFETQYEGFHVMFAGQYPPNPVELLSHQDFSELLKESKKKYDYVLVDTPPLGQVIDTAVIAPCCDGVILVISDNNVKKSQAKDVIEQLNKSGSKILGAVRNNTKRNNNHAYKKYGYGK